MVKHKISPEEIAQFRKDTRGTRERIHFNNAGTSLPPDVVVDRVIDYLREEALYGGYETEAKYSRELENVYGLIGRLIHADSGEIALTENASAAWAMAFNGITYKAGDEIIISELEYVTNMIAFLHLRKTTGIVIRVVPNDERGNFSLEGLEAAITPATRLIAITHIPSSAGSVMPIAAIGKIAKRQGILYLVDACQTAGHMPIDVEEIGCDFLSVTGRKFLRAPRGSGFLYVRKAVQEQLETIFMDGRSIEFIDGQDYKLKGDARRFELFESNRAIRLGLGKAVEYALEIGVDRIWERIGYLAGKLRDELRRIPGVVLRDQGAVQCGIVTFTVEGLACVVIKERLGERKINVSVGPAVSTPLYMQKNHLADIVRASIHYYNTEEEIGAFIEVLRVCVG